MTGDSKPLDDKALSERLDLNFALQAAGLGVWELDPLTQVINWDECCQSMFGLSARNSLPYEQVMRYVHPDDRRRVDQAVRWVLHAESGGEYDITYRTIGANDGILRWVRFMGHSYFNDQGQATRFAGIAQDVTKNVQIQQVVASEERFRTLVEQAPVAIAVLRGNQFRFEIANQAYLPLIGKNHEEVLGKPLFEVLPETRPVLEPIVRELIRTGVPFPATEFKIVLNRLGRDETCYFNSIWEPLRQSDGTIDGFVVVAHEVTEQVLARRKLEESEAKFRSLIEEDPVATCLFVGRELIIELANEPMLKIWGKGKTVFGKPLAKALPELEGQPFLAILDEAFTTGQPYEAKDALAELEVDGVLGTYYFDFTYKPLRNGAGEVYAIMETVVDVTEQVLARQKLEESEKLYRMLSEQLEIQVLHRTEDLAASNEELATSNEELAATNEELAATNEELATSNVELAESNQLLERSNQSLQQFAYIASHDLQEPLRKIQAFSELLQDEYADQLGEGIEHLQRMQTAANRMSTLIRDVLAFSRISTRQDTGRLIPLTEVVGLALTDLDIMIREAGAVLKIDPLPTVMGDASQLGQLFQNLLSNALKFHQPGVAPVIRIHAYLITSSQLPADVKPTRPANAYHRIDISDNGIGFEPKHAERIFQVFQRLHGRATYAGTGIGLAICEKVAANHGGAITAHSQPGQGATFSLYLPV